MRNRIPLLAAVAAALTLTLACQQPAANLQYVKYNSDADVPRISIQDAKSAVDNGTAVIVDSRGADAYAMEHIKDSISVPFGVGAEDKFNTLPKGKKLIVYCS